MAEISVATFDQIATILSKLATNYSNLFIDYETLFYSDTPADVTIQIYNAAGELETFTIPNRAKDRRYILNGNGSPEGVVSAGKGAIYQDLTNGSLYLKQIGTDSQGWYIILSEAQLSEKLRLGDSSPEGVETAAPGTLYADKANGALYIKTTSTGNTGWKLISASTSLLASIDLDNLSDEGETHFANPSLSNLNIAGQALIDSKENVNNKVTTLSSSSTDTQYPSAKVVYNNLTSLDNKLATRELDNLTAAGEEHFIGKPQIRDCILYAPNGLVTYSGNVINIPAGTVLLGANGLNLDGTNKLVRRVLNNSVSVSLNWTYAGNGVAVLLFSTAGDESIWYWAEKDFFVTTSVPTLSSTQYACWYNPDTHVYKYTLDSGSTWVEFVGVTIALYSTNSSGNIISLYSYHPFTASTEDDIHRVEILLRRDLESIDPNFITLASKGTINLTTNSVNTITPTGNVTLVLPSVSSSLKLNQILVQINMSTVYSINVGTTTYFNNKTPNLSSKGKYDLIYEYDEKNNVWVCGWMKKGA